MIVDDMATFRLMVKQTLSDLGYKNYVEAVDGAQAWTAIEEARNTKDPFGLVISDWTMPKMKGIELLKKVRAQDWGLNMPFILLTGETEKASIVEAIENRVTRYIIKPFTADSMKQNLKLAYEKVKKETPEVIIE